VKTAIRSGQAPRARLARQRRALRQTQVRTAPGVERSKAVSTATAGIVSGTM